MNKKRLEGILLALISAVAFGTYPILARFTLGCGVTTWTILFLRFLCCAGVLWLYCLAKGKMKGLTAKTALGLLGIGMVAYAAMSALNLAAITRISTSLASLLLCAYPVFVALFSVLLGREKPSWLLAISLAVCVVGLWLVIDVHSVNVDLPGLAMAVGASISYAVYVLGGSMLGGKADPILRATLIMSGACLAYMACGAAMGEIRFAFEPVGWAWLAGMVILTTVVPVTLFWLAIDQIGAVDASILGIVEPISTVILSVWVLGEQLRGGQILGIAIALSGILLIQLPQLRGEKAEG